MVYTNLIAKSSILIACSLKWFQFVRRRKKKFQTRNFVYFHSSTYRRNGNIRSITSIELTLFWANSTVLVSCWDFNGKFFFEEQRISRWRMSDELNLAHTTAHSYRNHIVIYLTLKRTKLEALTHLFYEDSSISMRMGGEAVKEAASEAAREVGVREIPL